MGELFTSQNRAVTEDVLFLEIDAGDKHLILDWARAGVMPNVQALLARGLVTRASGPFTSTFVAPASCRGPRPRPRR